MNLKFKLLNNVAKPFFLLLLSSKHANLSSKMSALLLGQIDKYDLELFVRM